ncbi:Nucleosomal histone kinase 1 [Frankliniella fusca]|uniref:non-specific serine/threonine protein kinase n=1 Tax=Frankliniella fusca TaxID=407009 RepID=A0AAE1L8P0_9NEOP|nr:Nucleosomal histone kinase 1 [Frankliniella fusca]
MPPKKSKLYAMAAPLPKNEVLTDTLKQKWILGKSIGKGGFGEIYSAAAGESVPKNESDFAYVIKIEPKENGPLFVEKTFYLRAGKAVDVNAWKEKNKLKTFGMPIMHGNGIHESGSSKYRFLVMDRYSKDLYTLWNSCNKSFPLSTVLQIAIQILDVYEYIHSKGYVHADIKPANLLLGLKKGTENQVYVVDFGLAARYTASKDPKRAHNGTIEYVSRDAHAGGTTRRGDMEILAYNVVQLLSSKLPWEGLLKDCVAVHKAKEAAMQNVPQFLKSCFGKKQVPDVVSKFVNYVSEMSFEAEPDYSKVRKIFLDGLKSEGVKFESPLCFTKPLEQQNGVTTKVRTSPRKAAKRGSTNSKPGASKESEMENRDSSCSNNFEESDVEKEEETPPKKRRVAAKPKPKDKEKVSWRDCPTVKASRVTRPGEFVPLNPKPKKKS